MANPSSAVLTEEVLKSNAVPQILAVIPAGWRGTTFNNSNLLGRDEFSDRLTRLLVSKAGVKAGDAGAITSDDLSALGNAGATATYSSRSRPPPSSAGATACILHT